MKIENLCGRRYSRRVKCLQGPKVFEDTGQLFRKSGTILGGSSKTSWNVCAISSSLMRPATERRQFCGESPRTKSPA